eukprot:GHVS01028371.1.p1 GENE.GHVS01028371.1~~GHVS01028371.1.p1  ORF type:complete len:199 (-),score=34.29 GHVS01028371.1:397-993(-)
MGAPGKQYVMEDIVEYKLENRQDYYLVQWKGYTSAENSWEPRKNIISPNDPTLAKMKRLKRRWKSKYGDNGERAPTETEAEKPATPARRRKPEEHNSTEEQSHESSSAKRRRKNETEAEEAADELLPELPPTGPAGVKVKNIKPVDGELAVHALGDGLPPEEDRYFMPLQEFRELHPQPLITFFLKNLKFVNDKSKDK